MIKPATDNDANLDREQLAKVLHELRTYQIELEMQNEELRLAQEEIIHSHARYTDLYDFAPLGYATVDKKGKIVEANLTLAAMLGVEKANLLHTPWSGVVFEKDQDIYYLHRQLLIETRGRQTFELRMKGVKGIIFSAQLDCVISTNIDGESGQHRIAITDISARKAVEAERAELSGQLWQAQKMQALGTLSGGIAHEFNNMLTIILGCADVAQERLLDKGFVATQLEQILIASERARNLVLQILTFSRKSERKSRILNLGVAVEETLGMLASTLPTSVTMRRMLDMDGCTVRSDPTEIHQVLANLCANGIHAMKEKGSISICLEKTNLDTPSVLKKLSLPPGQYAVLSVTDTGCGMDEKTQERVFEPFFTTKEVGQGTGMGLSLIYGIMQRNHGGISVESALRKGTTFRLYYPTTQERAPVAKVGRTRQACAGNESVLVVDDDEMVGNAIRMILEQLGYTVTLETNSNDACELFSSQSNTFDLVITDQVMPGLTGAELAKSCLQTRPNIPIILCTGHSARVDKSSAKAAGIKAYVMKPISKYKLAELVREVLDGSSVGAD